MSRSTQKISEKFGHCISNNFDEMYRICFMTSRYCKSFQAADDLWAIAHKPFEGNLVSTFQVIWLDTA